MILQSSYRAPVCPQAEQRPDTERPEGLTKLQNMMLMFHFWEGHFPVPSLTFSPPTVFFHLFINLYFCSDYPKRAWQAEERFDTREGCESKDKLRTTENASLNIKAQRKARVCSKQLFPAVTLKKHLSCLQLAQV